LFMTLIFVFFAAERLSPQEHGSGIEEGAKMHNYPLHPVRMNE